MTRNPIREIASVARLLHALHRAGADTARKLVEGYAPPDEVDYCLEFVCQRIWLDPDEAFPANEDLTILAYTEAILAYEFRPRRIPYTTKQLCEAVSRVCREHGVPEQEIRP